MNMIPPRPVIPQKTVPPLCNGDRLTQVEFHRRYEASPPNVKAELIGGTVYMASPLGLRHGVHHVDLSFLLKLYVLSTTGSELTDNATTILNAASEPQPDLTLRILPDYGGQSRTTTGKVEYIEGAPELVAEVSHSSVGIDLHQKRDDYLRAGVVEYVVVCVAEQEIHWFHFPSDTSIAANRQGVAKSQVFPGLWLGVPDLLNGDMKPAMAVMQQGLASRAHATFVKRLAAAHKQRPT